MKTSTKTFFAGMIAGALGLAGVQSYRKEDGNVRKAANKAKDLSKTVLEKAQEFYHKTFS